METRVPTFTGGRASRSAARQSGRAIAWYCVLCAGPALAQTPTPLPPIGIDVDQGVMCPLDGSVVSQNQLQSMRAATADTARLFVAQPGVALQTGGAVSSLPVMRGLGDDRIRILVDGMTLQEACPNHMNPPLSYIDPTNVSFAQAMPGVTPVSLGGDSIGGTIVVDAPPPAFAAEGNDVEWHGLVSTFFRSNSSSVTTSATISAATPNTFISYTGAYAKAENYTDGSGHNILASQFETFNQSATLGLRDADSLFVLRAGQQNMPYQGFPNQRMDLLGNHSWFINGAYTRQFDWGNVDGRVYFQNVNHYMNFLEDRGGREDGGMPMYTHGQDLGYRVKATIPLTDIHTVRIGSDFDFYRLNDWWTAVDGSMMMGPNTYQNINNGVRTRFGVFTEAESKWTPKFSTLLGMRLDTVWMNTGQVQPYSWAPTLGMGMGMGMGMDMGMPNPDAAAATAFNAANRQRTNVNFDMTALARYEASDVLTGELGYARKTRTPNLYERYSWGTGEMAESMIGWFGDANLYRGNLNLVPEVAHTISTSAAWHDSAKADWELRVTPYFTYVQDFIGANRIGTVQQGGSTFAVLQFANRDARLYGVDVSGQKAVWSNPTYGNVGLNGVVGWVQGQYIDTGKSLYHMMPLNALLSLTHELDGWSSAAELRLVAPKALVDPTRNEPWTPGFALVNLRTSYTYRNIRLDFAIENLLNQQYYEPLGGVNYANWASAGQVGQIGPLPAMGRSFIVGVTIKL